MFPQEGQQYLFAFAFGQIEQVTMPGQKRKCDWRVHVIHIFRNPDKI